MIIKLDAERTLLETFAAGWTSRGNYVEGIEDDPVEEAEALSRQYEQWIKTGKTDFYAAD